MTNFSSYFNLMRFMVALLFTISSPFVLDGQSSVNTAGGNITGAAGVQSFSIGQVFTSFLSGGGLNIAQGVQLALNPPLSNVTNVTQATNHATLQSAINLANAGDILEVNVDLTEGLIWVNKALTIRGMGGVKNITSTSPNFGFSIGVSNVTIKDIKLANATSFGIAVNAADNLLLENVTIENCGYTGFALNCSNNITLRNVTANSNGGNAVTINDCNSVTIDGITTDGLNRFLQTYLGQSSLSGMTGGIGIFASGNFCTAGVNGVTITGAVNMTEYVALYEKKMGTGAGITNVSYSPAAGSTPASLPYFVGRTQNDKAYQATLAEAYTNASTLIAGDPSYKPDVFVQEVGTGKKFINDGLVPVPWDNSVPGKPANYDGPHALSITAAATHSQAGNVILVEEGDYTENVVINNAVVITGPNTGNDPCSSTSGAATVKSLSSTSVFTMNAGGTITGLIIDGEDQPNVIGVSANAGSVVLTYNCIKRCEGSGVLFTTGGGGEVDNNDFSGNKTDLRLNGSAGMITSCTNNDFSGINYGVNNTSGNNVNALDNWWGDGVAGPGVVGLGTGAKVSGNVDYCTWLDAATPVGIPVVFDSPIDCNNPFFILGEIDFWYNGAGVKDVVTSVAPVAPSSTTNLAGEYQLQPSAGGAKVVTPAKAINKFNGVNAADVTLIRRHISSGYKLLTDAEAWIACDIDENKKIDVLDAVILQQAINGNPTAIAKFLRSWRFVPKTHVFPSLPIPGVITGAQVANVLTFPESINLTLNAFVLPTDTDFWGTKIGDPDGTANTQLRPGNTPMVFRTADRELVAGEEITLPFTIDGFYDIAAFQYELAFDNATLEFTGLTCNPESAINESDFGLFDIADGRLRSVFALENGVTFNSEMQHFTFTFKVLQGGKKLSEVMNINTESIEALAFNNDLNPQPVELAYSAISGTNTLEASGLNLSVRPNPAHGMANVNFNLNEYGDVQLRVFDVTGKLIYTQQETLPAGTNTLVLPLENVSGLLLVELQTAQGYKTIKLVAENN